MLYGAYSPWDESSSLVRIGIADADEDRVVGSIGYANVIGLAYDNLSGMLYGLTDGGRLLQIDESTGSGTEIAALHMFTFSSLTFGANTGLLYTVRNFPPDPALLYSIDPNTAVVTPQFIGTITGHARVSGLTFFGGRLYAVTDDTQRLLRLTIGTSQITVTDLGPLGSGALGGLAAYEGP